jgi:hypothetical protein
MSPSPLIDVRTRTRLASISFRAVTRPTTRSRNSKEHDFGIDPPSRIRINAARFNYAGPVGES